MEHRSDKRGMTISMMGVWRPLCSEVQSIYSSLLTTSATQYTGDMTESLFSNVPVFQQ